MTDQSRLDLDGLFEDLPGITKAGGASCYEAILICLQYHHHESGAICNLNDFDATLATLEIIWSKELDAKTCRAWGEPRNAVEDAAIGIAFLIVLQFTEFTVIERANIGTGIDYWLGYKEDVERDKFLPRARMETSGIMLQRYTSGILQRIKDKLEQTKQSDIFELPAYVIVTEFSRPVIYLVQR